MLTEYHEFLDAKRHSGANQGFDPVYMPSTLFDFQADLVTWAVTKGRAAIFADCGLGKTLMELVWAENIHRHTNKPVLLLTPLAVSAQTIREAAKFDIESERAIDGKPHTGITITNYEQLHKFEPSDFAGVVCDESSILKSFDGARKDEITNFMRKVPYRLLATATAAPNDYTELGTSSEALGYMGLMDMLGRFFKNDHNNIATRRMYGEAPKWRFKGHSQVPFWRWVTSWARAVRKPSDIGYDDARFILPPLYQNEHIVDTDYVPDGTLFAVEAATLREQREVSKATVQDRCQRVADMVNDTGKPALVWCHRNDEGDTLEQLIPDAVQVSGSDRDAVKEERLLAFANGDARVLITKPKIGAWGLNFQHCNHVTYFPSHSFEGFYQAVRRCWRFGQENPVTVDVVMTEGERRVMSNLSRKSKAADDMFAALVSEMNNAQSFARVNDHTNKQELPTWL